MSFLPSPTKLWQGNVFTPVCHSVHGGVSASVHAGIHIPPWADTPLADTLPGRPPWVDPPGQTPPRRHPSPADTPLVVTAADGAHPTGMHSCCKCGRTLVNPSRIKSIKSRHNTSSVFYCLLVTSMPDFMILRKGAVPLRTVKERACTHPWRPQPLQLEGCIVGVECILQIPESFVLWRCATLPKLIIFDLLPDMLAQFSVD